MDCGTLRQAATYGADTLRGVPELADHAARDAETLLLDQLGLDRADLRAHPERELTPAQWTCFQGRIDRRLRCEPIQYITGHQEFFGLDLHVSPAVLIPRPETELLVEQVLAYVAQGSQAPRILDIGTGSGAIAIALATHLPRAAITAVDLSEDALAVARTNAATHGVFSSIRFLQSDLLDALAGERFEVVVSNPPYVPLIDRISLHPQVREYEPELALFAGDAGLDIYRRLIPAAHEALLPGGLLALEIGHGQLPELAALLAHWTGVSFYEDLRSIPRVVLAQK